MLRKRMRTRMGMGMGMAMGAGMSMQMKMGGGVKEVCGPPRRRGGVMRITSGVNVHV